jgi:hypothetical protein
MANIVDILELVLVLTGAQQYLSFWTTVTPLIVAATDALKTFTAEQTALFQTGLILRNLHSTLTLPQVQQFAEATSERTGISRIGIEQTAAELARTGVSGQQIAGLLGTIADAARGTGRSFQEVGEAAEKGILGHMRGLAQFGIVLQDTGSKAANLALIQQQLAIRFQGAADAFRDTLPGAISAFQASWERLMASLGELFGDSARRALEALIFIVDQTTAAFKALATWLEESPVDTPFLGPATVRTHQNPLEKVGRGGDPATEATLQQVADNTKLMADAVEQQVLGGTGEVVRQQFGWLQARIAMNI